MSNNPYLDALNDAAVRKYLDALHNAEVAKNTPTTTTPPATTTGTPGGSSGGSAAAKVYQSWHMYDPRNPNNTNSFYGTAEEAQAYATANGMVIGDSPDDAKKDDKKDSAADSSSASAYITTLLKKYGLDSLAGWAMDQIRSGASADEIIQALRDRPEYKARFPGMDTRRTNGLGALSEDEYIAYENQTKDYMQRAGMPSGLYDDPGDFSGIIGNFANVGQVADRIQKGYQMVAEAPPEVRQYMASHFGVEGDAALAAYFLDPTRNEPLLIKAAQTATIGGYGMRQGLDISTAMASNVADMGLSTQQIQAGTQQAGMMGGLQQQTVDEAAAKAAGLTADTLVGATFGVDAATRQTVEGRLGTRKAQFDTKGSAAASQKGAYGLEVAQ